MKNDFLEQYSILAEKFKRFLKINGYEYIIERDYVFGGASNKKFFSIGVELPFFDYDKIEQTTFFENQKNYDLSICKTSNSKGKKVVLISVLLKDLYSESFCQESEFVNILNKINTVKREFLIN